MSLWLRMLAVLQFPTPAWWLAPANSSSTGSDTTCSFGLYRHCTHVAHVPVGKKYCKGPQDVKRLINSCDVVLFSIFFQDFAALLSFKKDLLYKQKTGVFVFVWPCVFLFDVLHGQHPVFMSSYDEIYIAFQVIIRYKIFSNALYLLCIKPGQ